MIDYSYIIKENHEDIRKLSENVKIPLSKEDKETMYNMYEYLINGYDEELAKKLNIRPGVGIAAPQIDILKKMFVIVAYDEHDELHEYGVINPKIVSHSEELTYLKGGEGCLSVDREVSGLIHRPKKITVEFDLEAGDRVEIVEGPLNTMIGEVVSVSAEEEVSRAKVKVEMFGRETIVELDYSQLRKIEN